MAARMAARSLSRRPSSTGKILTDEAKTKAANFSTTAETKTMHLRNRPLSPFLSQKRPEKSSTLSIGERMVLIAVGLVVLPAPEIAKLSLFMY